MNPVLLLHGALGSCSQLEPIAVRLASNGRKVYSMDFSGHNGKPFSSNGFGIHVFAQDVIDFLKDQQLSKVDIFGYSMGGYVALWLASQHPELIGTVITVGTKFDWDKASAEREVKKMNPDLIEQKVPAFARVLEHRHSPVDWKELLLKTGEMMTSLGHKPLLTDEIFRKIQTPVLISLGDLDDMADRSYSEHVAGLLPKGEFRLLENTTHQVEKLKYIPFVDLNFS